jgi:predicted nucleic acid-binding protein
MVKVPLPAGDWVVLDTSVVIAYLNGHEVVSEAARSVLDGLIATERNPGWISSVTVGEVLIRPLRDDGRHVEVAKSFLLDFPGLSIRSADFLVAAEAADIRASTGASLADAMIAATATVTSSQWLITNDRELRDRLANLDWQTKVVLLSELQVTQPGSNPRTST